jgi:hypothetical protein
MSRGASLELVEMGAAAAGEGFHLVLRKHLITVVLDPSKPS